MVDGRQDQEAKERFFAALAALYHGGEEPPKAALARKLHLNRNTVGKVLNGRLVPGPRVLDALVRELGGEAEVPRFRDLRRRIFVPDPGPAPGSAVTGQERRESLDVHYFDTTTEFYSRLGERLDTAEREICVTYIREMPPNRFADDAARRYFDKVLRWAATEGRQVMRVIGVPMPGGSPNPRFLEWLREHHRETRDLLAYEAKVIGWTLDTDSLNMALFDGVTAFVTFNRSGHELSGLTTDSRMFVRRWRGHFNQLWTHARPLDVYLAEHG